MQQRRVAAGGVTLVLLLGTPTIHSAAASEPPDAPFEVTEATIDSISTAFADGDLTCVDLVQSYIDRIDAYD